MEDAIMWFVGGATIEKIGKIDAGKEPSDWMREVLLT